MQQVILVHLFNGGGVGVVFLVLASSDWDEQEHRGARKLIHLESYQVHPVLM